MNREEEPGKVAEGAGVSLPLALLVSPKAKEDGKAKRGRSG